MLRGGTKGAERDGSGWFGDEQAWKMEGKVIQGDRCV